MLVLLVSGVPKSKFIFELEASKTSRLVSLGLKLDLYLGSDISSITMGLSRSLENSEELSIKYFIDFPSCSISSFLG